MTTTSKATTKVKPPTPAKAKRVSPPSTAFSITAPDAHEVFLIGDFNDWQAGELKARKFKDGTWTKSVKLKAGTYQYLFLVDGEWCTDPANPKRALNPFGSENSVVEVQ